VKHLVKKRTSIRTTRDLLEAPSIQLPRETWVLVHVETLGGTFRSEVARKHLGSKCVWPKYHERFPVRKPGDYITHGGIGEK
jgi:hypothetical protein